jgi:hypothetical protein
MPFGPEHNSTMGESLDRQVKDEAPPPWPFPTGSAKTCEPCGTPNCPEHGVPIGLSQFDKWFHDQQLEEQHRYICKLAYEAGKQQQRGDTALTRKVIDTSYMQDNACKESP